MKFPYLPARVSRPRATLGGGQVRHRPVVPIRVIGPGSFLVRDGLLVRFPGIRRGFFRAVRRAASMHAVLPLAISYCTY